jgi:hypothetical protein
LTELHADAFVATFDMLRTGYAVAFVADALVVRDGNGTWVAGQRCNVEDMDAVAKAVLLAWRHVRIGERLRSEYARALRVEENEFVEQVWARVLDAGKLPVHDE